ncbi:MAG TPA: disulfide bond formation protein B [Halococcus sp.]|nr:disulfide bond formation protein B [Halococcus sp.]
MRRIDTRLPLASGTLVAIVATAGSLYLSEILGLIPCELCWYQRILMYPLTVVLGVAALENRTGVYRTVLPLSILGAAIAAYHSWLQVSGASGTCSVGVGCAAVQYRFLGLTVPNLSLIAFVLISLVLLVAFRGR